MINRIAQYLKTMNAIRAAPTDYWWIETPLSGYFVSARTARSVEHRLEREPMPRWLVFRDLAGARHRVLATSVRLVTESTATQRAERRAFVRELQREREQDADPWDDGERSI